MVCVAVAEILIEGLGDEIVLVVVWAEQAKHVGVDLQPGGVAADRVMLDPQLSGCHAGSLQAFEAKGRALCAHEGGSWPASRSGLARTSRATARMLRCPRADRWAR